MEVKSKLVENPSNDLKSECLKITGKVAFNIASEASYVHILSEQKFIFMPEKVNFGEFLKT